MAYNEQTSKQVASDAAALLAMQKPSGIDSETWRKIQSVSASALTQTPDKKSIIYPNAYFKNLSQLRDIGMAAAIAAASDAAKRSSTK